MTSYVILCHSMSSYVSLCHLMTSPLNLVHLLLHITTCNGYCKTFNCFVRDRHERVLEGPSPLENSGTKGKYAKRGCHCLSNQTQTRKDYTILPNTIYWTINKHMNIEQRTKYQLERLAINLHRLAAVPSVL